MSPTKNCVQPPQRRCNQETVEQSMSDFVLPGYEAGPSESGVAHSIQKLDDASHRFPSWLATEVKSQHCASESETWSYRCRCTFQLLREKNGFEYAMRHKGVAISLQTDAFPIATARIQKAMRDLLEVSHLEEFNSIFVASLTSCSFSSAWEDVPTSDCIITLFYGEPIEDTEAWLSSAAKLCDQLCLRQLYGRSKNCLLVGVEDGDNESSTTTIRDSIFLTRVSPIQWNVGFEGSDSTKQKVEVRYEKPETAFYHPNAGAMIKALTWMLHRVSSISESGGISMLEMYCGCGAHTVALGKTGLFKEVTAVELDHRLVEACMVNVNLNNLKDMVQVVQGDAGVWAKRNYKWSSQSYDVLLVDPPRAGLDRNVCQMALRGSFKHFIYISCGHKALLRDLEVLAGKFDVIDVQQMDLFPRTDSIETLVHLKRRL